MSRHFLLVLMYSLVLGLMDLYLYTNLYLYLGTYLYSLVLALIVCILPPVPQIQMHSFHKTWWGVDSSDPSSSHLTCSNHNRTAGLADSPLTFTVTRVGPSAVRLLTSNGQYVVAMENGRMGASEWVASPRTLFVVQQVTPTASNK